MDLALVKDLHAGGPLAQEGDAPDECMSENRQVCMIHERESIGAEYRQALSITDAHIGDRGARIGFHQATIRVFKRRNTDGTSSFNRRRGEGIWIRRGLNKHAPAG